MADRIVILSAGRVVLEGTPHGLTTGAAGAGGRAAGRHLRRAAGLDTGALAAAVGAGTIVNETAPGRYRVEASGVATPAVTAAVATLPGRARRHPHRPGGGQDPRGRVLRDGGRRGRPAPPDRRPAATPAGAGRRRRGAGGPGHDAADPAAAPCAR